MTMTRILRSKPVLFVGGAALVNKVAKARSRKRRKSLVSKLLSGLLVTGATSATVKYFKDPILGQKRRQKVLGLMGRSNGGADEWQPTQRQPEIAIPESTPTPSV